MRLYAAASIGLVLLSFIMGIYFYPTMPAQVASHWGINGGVNGYCSKFCGLFLMPAISLVLLAFFFIIPKIDPLKKNIEKFRKHFDFFVLLIIAFLFYLHLLTIGWNLGLRFNMVQFLSPAFGVLLFYCGVLIGNAKRNWSIGIRTPWTLSDDVVWEKTHRIGAKLFKASGIISFFGILLPGYSILLIIAPVIIAAVYSVAYSYLEFNKRHGDKKRIRRSLSSRARQ